ncbi:MAG: type I glyceraldehyde-3-phosphate dehydrogenase [Ahrensia sp.]|nr:type I glyceraldehyde-3-phosphate dehydrogenase [Ahrensia sp.]
MTLKVAINGFGRIGRNVLRAAFELDRDDIEIVAINDLAPIETNAHLLRFDSVHGRFPGSVEVRGDAIFVEGPARRAGDTAALRMGIEVTSERDPSALPWDNVDIVLECTGIFTNAGKAAVHLENGAKGVLISAPLTQTEKQEKTVVYGVNHDTLTSDDTVVSNASCTTNCLAPLAKVMHESFGITKGYMTTIHSYTGDQPTLDTFHKDLYRARAAAMSMIPTSTGAAKAVGLVLPDLKGKLDGSAIRVPTPNVSCVDLTFVASRDCTVEEVNAAAKEASEGALKGILAYEGNPLVSMDFNHDPHSSSFASAQTQVTDGNLVRVLSWYDNEWGFSCRMLDTAVEMGKLL